MQLVVAISPSYPIGIKLNYVSTILGRSVTIQTRGHLGVSVNTSKNPTAKLKDCGIASTP